MVRTMLIPQKLARLRQAREQILHEGQLQISRGRYPEAEAILNKGLAEWRREGGPKEEEHLFILPLGKSLELQRKKVEAYELYLKALNNLTGAAYDEVYDQFLYLNQSMGAFDKKPDYGY